LGAKIKPASAPITTPIARTQPTPTADSTTVLKDNFLLSFIGKSGEKILAITECFTETDKTILNYEGTSTTDTSKSELGSTTVNCF
jgi:hypothetical protein